MRLLRLAVLIFSALLAMPASAQITLTRGANLSVDAAADGLAPSVARRDGSVLAVGSPGADRITTAMQQFFINYLQFEMSLENAIAHPRLHVDTSGADIRLMAEPGLDLPIVDMPVTVFPERLMYFGGVGAAAMDEDIGLISAADPRREGGTCVYYG